VSDPRKPDVPPVDAEHYSYALYADPAHAGKFDALRFSGPIGTLVAESQERVLLDFLPGLTGQRVLDVGTGTGRGAFVLARCGAVVTGVDASEQMLDVARQRAGDLGLAVDFVRGDAHALAFDDRSFDVAVCLRVIMHTPDWRRCVGELCRVARGRVVFDFPSATSAAAIQAMARRVAARFGSRTEAYRVFSVAAVRDELASHGFVIHRIQRQFVLPIAFHKAIDSRAFTERVEGGFRAIGLDRLFGSPVTIEAVPAGAAR
jgi:2-polyprenyl-3-methyl-5-hydroxy-6-metoxy-1,4-benzoquinol methylase